VGEVEVVYSRRRLRRASSRLDWWNWWRRKRLTRVAFAGGFKRERDEEGGRNTFGKWKGDRV